MVPPRAPSFGSARQRWGRAPARRVLASARVTRAREIDLGDACRCACGGACGIAARVSSPRSKAAARALARGCCGVLVARFGPDTLVARWLLSAKFLLVA